MSNPYYNGGAFPATGAPATSASMRAELASISTGFDKLPTLSGNASKLVTVNSSGTALEAVSVLPSLTITDTNLVVEDNADSTRKFRFEASGVTAGTTRVLTVPDVSTTLVGTDAVQTLTNKTINLTSNLFTATSAQLAAAVTDETGSGALVFGTSPTISGATLGGSVTVSAGTANQVQYLNASKVLVGSANLTFDGTALTLGGNPTVSSGTANGVTYLNGSKVLTSGSALTFDGTNLGVLAGSVTSPAAKIHAVGSVRASTGTGTVYTQLANDGVYSTGTDLYLLAPTGYSQIFYANNTEQMRLTSTGLGIGTSSPAAKLSLEGTGTYLFTLNNTAQDARIRLLVSGTEGGQISASATTLNVVGTSSIGFRTNGALVGTWDASGNLGLGVTPSAWAGLGYGALQVGRASLVATSSASQTLYNANAYYDNVSWKYIASAPASRYQQNGGAHSWDIAASGTAGNTISFTQAMTLTSGGDLLVGKTASSDTTLGAEMQAGGAVVSTRAGSTSAQSTFIAYSTGASAYRFYVGMNGTINATNTTISAISDQRFKENIQDLDIGLDKIMALKPRKFDWKAGKGKDIKGDRGFIAQEFEQVFPDLIDEWKDPAPEGEEPYKSVRQDLIPVLVKAIQELKAELDSVKAELATLKGQP